MAQVCYVVCLHTNPAEYACFVFKRRKTCCCSQTVFKQADTKTPVVRRTREETRGDEQEIDNRSFGHKRWPIEKLLTGVSLGGAADLS